MNSQVLLLGALWLASRQAFGATCLDKAGKTIPIRVADKAEYTKMQYGRPWPNPEISVSVEGFAVMGLSRVWSRSLTFEDTLVTLDQLGCDAWPFGAVVQLSESGLGSGTPEVQPDIRARLERLKAALEHKGMRHHSKCDDQKWSEAPRHKRI